MKKSNPFLRSVQSYLQSEMFLSNSVDMMKNLLTSYIVCTQQKSRIDAANGLKRKTLLRQQLELEFSNF